MTEHQNVASDEENMVHVMTIKGPAFPDGSGRSQQIDPGEGRVTTIDLINDELLDVDYDPEQWAKTPEMNTRLRTSIRIMARNIAGLEWTIEPTKNESSMTDEEKKKYEQQRAVLLSLFNRPNPKLPLSETLYRCWYDRKAVGTGHLEIVRGGDNRIIAIHHVQSKFVKALKNGGWLQKKNSLKRYFKDFGDTRVINAESGKVHDGKKNGALSIDDRATELISFIEYSSDAEVVGVPPHASAARAISGSYYSDLRNRNAQFTDPTKKVIIAITGGQLQEESPGEIRDFMNAGARNEEDMRSNRALVISIPKASGNASVQPKIEVVPLSMGSTEEAAFQDYRKNNNDEIREGFSIASLFYGSTEGTNRASASVARHITIEQAFNPETKELEYRINFDVVVGVLTHPNLTIDGQKPKWKESDILAKFSMIRPPASDEVERSEIISRYGQIGALAPNDVRRHLKKQGFELDQWEGAWAEIPLFVTLALLKAGVLLSDLGIPDIDGIADGSSQEEIEEAVLRQVTDSIKGDLRLLKGNKS